MAEREVEAAAPRAQRTSARRALGQPDRLGRHAPAAVAPDDLVLDAEALAQRTVWAKSRAVTRTSAPRARSTSMTGRRTSTWGLLVRSTQIRIAHGGHDLGDLVARERRGLIGMGQVRAGDLVGRGQLGVARRRAIAGWRWIGVR